MCASITARECTRVFNVWSEVVLINVSNEKGDDVGGELKGCTDRLVGEKEEDVFRRNTTRFEEIDENGGRTLEERSDSEGVN